MNMLTWCKNTFFDDICQKELEEKINSLLQGPLRNRSEYAQEKAIKSFSEGLRSTERLLLKQREIYPTDIAHNPMVFLDPHFKSEYSKALMEIRNTMLSEIKRQYRHFLTFL